VLNALSAESREKVDQLLERALEAGGSEHTPRDPVEMEQMYAGRLRIPTATSGRSSTWTRDERGTLVPDASD